MSASRDLDVRLERLSAEVDRWTRAFFDRHRPTAGRFAGMLSYPLGWVDASLSPLERPAPAGKRLRPALCLLICEAVGGDHQSALPAAAAIELIHNFSLVHDDIQDESPLRRQRPTVWAEWGAAQAINVGDSLFALAQLALVEADQPNPAWLVEAVRQLNATCLRLVEGQYLDIELQSNGRASLEAYQTMVGGKTAALLECAAWLGARCGGAEANRLGRFAEFGRQLGLSFQFQDDWLGVWGDPTETGKSADSDLRTRKPALPAVLALQSRGSPGDRFRELFTAPSDLSDDQAAEARRLLDQLNIRQQTSGLVEAGFAGAAAVLREALGDQPESPLWAFLEHVRERTN